MNYFLFFPLVTLCITSLEAGSFEEFFGLPEKLRDLTEKICWEQKDPQACKNAYLLEGYKKQHKWINIALYDGKTTPSELCNGKATPVGGFFANAKNVVVANEEMDSIKAGITATLVKGAFQEFKDTPDFDNTLKLFKSMTTEEHIAYTHADNLSVNFIAALTKYGLTIIEKDGAYYVTQATTKLQN